MIARLLDLLLILGLGALVGYVAGRMHEAEQIAQCPTQAGKIAVSQHILKDGSSVCTYVRSIVGLAVERRPQ